jgi:hypothetical protein
MDEVLLLGRMRGVMVRFVRVGRLLLVDQLLTPLVDREGTTSLPDSFAISC